MAGLKVKEISFGYENKQKILREISFTANANEAIGIVGANGVGKSTLLKMMVGLLPIPSGEIFVEGVKLTEENLPKIREKMGFVFQDSDNQLFMPTVYEDIAFAPRNYGYLADEVDARVQHAMELTNTTHLAKKQIYKMSGGEKKLVSIATVLSMMPDIILMDEPTIALDPRNRRNLINILNSFSQIKIIASHDLDFILDTCERTILLSEGKIVCDGLTQEILTDRELMENNGLELPLRYQ